MSLRHRLAVLGGLSLDLKLGFRILVKYPGLTIVGGLAMAFAIWVGAVTLELVTQFVYPTLPVPGGDRVVSIRNWDAAARRAEARALHDFLVWRETLTSITDLGAYRDVTRNLVGADGIALPIEAADVTASAFRIAPDPPLLGRTLVVADERAGAPPVVVLGYDVWRMRFDGDSAVIGRTVQLDDTHATVVGVMPEGFAFPVAHDLWAALRPGAFVAMPRNGPRINVFGRLAPGVTLEEAQTELTTIGERAAAEFPDTHEHLVPEVAAYVTMFREPTVDETAALLSIYVFAVMLLGLVCGNVALLMFARAATRESEIVVRSALGASRGRIVAQLFAEALVLGAVAAVLGLAAGDLSLRRWGMAFLESTNMGRLPFWYDASLSPATVLHAIGLMLLGAAIAGVLPALKVTRDLGPRLNASTAGGGGLRFGGVWTAVIIAQVAVTVAFPAVAYVQQREQLRVRSFGAGFAAEEYLAVRVAMDAVSFWGGDDETTLAAQRARYGAALEALRGRLEAEPGVLGVTFVDRLPRTVHRERRIELDDLYTGSSAPRVPVARSAGATASPPGLNPLREVQIAAIDPSYFEVLEAPILAGRGFHTGDLAPDARSVIVDQGFVDQVLRGQEAIGRRVRFSARFEPEGTGADESRPWYEIVGVVKELGMGSPTQRGRAAGVYLPVVLDTIVPLHMMVHVQGDPMALTSRVRAIAREVDATLRLSEFRLVGEVSKELLWVLSLWLRITIVSTAIALLLSLAGIYAVLSFTVARRTREIGVRVALGASRGRVVTAIFRRPLTQVALGVAAGGVLIAAAPILLSGDGAMFGSGLSPRQLALLVAYVTFMLGVCLLACIVPTQRALRVEPTEALRAD